MWTRQHNQIGTIVGVHDGMSIYYSVRYDDSGALVGYFEPHELTLLPLVPPFRPPCEGDLVDCDGYYGLIVAVALGHFVIALSNGLTVEKSWPDFRQLDLKIAGGTNSPASFDSVIQHVKLQLRQEIRDEMGRAKAAGRDYDPLGPIEE